MELCPTCLENINILEFEDHMIACFEYHEQLQLEQLQEQLEYNELMETDKNIQEQLLQEHKNQPKLKPYIDPDLTEKQKAAFKYCKAKSKIHAGQTKGMVLIRFIELGYDEKDLEKVIDYIQNQVQVTINISTQTILKHVIYDDHIKNGYEIGRFNAAGNCGRTGWENNLFNKEYTGAEAIERVKYGSLNIFGNKTGTAAAVGYGDAFFLLRKEVNDRISFVNGDSAAMMLHICTFKHCVPLMVHLSDEYLKAIISHVTNKTQNKTQNNSQNQNFNYIEAQIHGDVRLDIDIEKLVITNKVFSSLGDTSRDKLNMFCQNNNITLEIV